MKKTYSKAKNKCKVTFSFPETSAKIVHIVGDFNDWNTNAAPMKKGKGGFSATVELDADQDYQYRFLVDGEHWQNDQAADGFAPGPYGEDNCIVSTRA